MGLDQARMRLVLDQPRDAATAHQVMAVLRRDPRWLRASTVMHRMMKQRAPALEHFLSGHRPLRQATELERRAWEIFVETIVPLVHCGVIEGEGNFGVPGGRLTDNGPMDHPFCRVRGRVRSNQADENAERTE